MNYHFQPQYGKTRVDYQNQQTGEVLFRFRVGDNVFCTYKVHTSNLDKNDRDYYLGK